MTLSAASVSHIVAMLFILFDVEIVFNFPVGGPV
jgi:NADH:ubiquinone oxidoreductase subunit 3 (subunit A)